MSKNRSILSVLKGDFFSKKESQNYFPFLFLIILLLLLNIRLSFNAESLLKESLKLERQITSLRLTYVNTKSELMKVYKRSEIEDLVKAQGLNSSNNPPRIIDFHE
jgi:cell division protein FtsL